jgi:NitT/TauT family transport system substrate-binding protein
VITPPPTFHSPETRMNNRFQRVRWYLSTAVLLAVFMMTNFGCWSCSRKAEPVTIGMDRTAVNSLIHIAVDQNYFSSNALQVTIKDYTSGLAAANGMLNREVDISTASEFVFVGKALKGDSIRGLASIDKFLHIYLVARKDRGIRSVSDLKGKTIGITLKTASEFYLGRFLDLHGMNMKQVTLINLSPPESVDALIKGNVDAVIAWQPSVKAMEDRLGGGIVKWGAQEGQAAYCMLIGRGDWVVNHPEMMKRFLRSLAQAEKFNIHHQAEAKAIIQKRLHYDDAYMAAFWTEHQLSVSLDQALIAAMEDEARWMIRSNLVSENQVPDFLNYTYPDALKAAEPDAVSIIR